MSATKVGYLYLSLGMVTVGSTVVASKVIAAGLPPFTATALRFAIALPVFLLLMRLQRARWPRLSPADWALLIVQALAGSVGYTTLLLSGLRLTSAADAGVIVGTLPVVSALVATLVLRERPDRSLWLAIGLATAGVIAVAVPSGSSSGGGPGGTVFSQMLGNALVLGAVACESLFILLNKRLRQAPSPLVLSTLMSAIGLAAAAGPAIYEGAWRVPMPDQALWAVLYYALVPTVGGYLLWYAGAARTSGSEAALFTALAPIAAVALAAGLLGEPVGIAQLGGIGCVAMAVIWLAARARPA